MSGWALSIRRLRPVSELTDKSGGNMKRAHNFRDLTGQRFGKMVVVSLQRITSDDSYWNIVCDCGQTKVCKGGNIRGGKVKSCGGLSCRWTRRPLGETASALLFKDYVRSARRRGIDFDISIDLFRSLTQEPCHYCGEAPKTVTNFKGVNGQYTYNGLDRIDSARGYEPENLVPCCRQCNTAKSALNRDDFLALVARVYRHRIVSRLVEKERAEW